MAWLVGIGFRSFGSPKIQGNWFLFFARFCICYLSCALCGGLWPHLDAKPRINKTNQIYSLKCIDTTLFQITWNLSLCFFGVTYEPSLSFLSLFSPFHIHDSLPPSLDKEVFSAKEWFIFFTFRKSYSKHFLVVQTLNNYIILFGKWDFHFYVWT